VKFGNMEAQEDRKIWKDQSRIGNSFKGEISHTRTPMSTGVKNQKESQGGRAGRPNIAAEESTGGEECA